MYKTVPTNLTELMLRHCYNCEDVCECTEQMIIACMNERCGEPVFDHEQTRELLRLYEQ